MMRRSDPAADESGTRGITNLSSPAEAVSAIRPGDVVAWACLTEPYTLDEALVNERERLRGVVMAHDMPITAHPWFFAEFGDYFRIYDNFPAITTRSAVHDGRVQFLPWPFGITTRDWASNPDRQNFFAKPDVYVTCITQPDEEGYVSVGTFPWFYEEAIESARLVIGEINPNLVYTNAKVHVSRFHFLLPPPVTPPERGRGMPSTPPDELDAAQVIGAYAAELIQDGDTIQIGAGPSAETMVDFLRDRHDLGVHSEVIFPIVVELMKEGVITGARKNVDRGKVVTAGLYLHPEDPKVPEALLYLRENQDLFEFRSLGKVANAKVISEQENMVAVNNVLGCDLTGQLVVNNLGPQPISGIGGNLDFTIGARYAKNGRSIHCLMTTAKSGTVSRIVPQHDTGSVISIPRTMVDYLVTEYGVVNLDGKSLQERARAIISIAHPDFREGLTQVARRLGLV